MVDFETCSLSSASFLVQVVYWVYCNWLTVLTTSDKDGSGAVRSRSGPRKRRFMEKDEDVDYSNLLGYQVTEHLVLSQPVSLSFFVGSLSKPRTSKLSHCTNH